MKGGYSWLSCAEECGEGDLSAGELEEKDSGTNVTESVNERLTKRRDEAGIPSRTLAW